MLRNVLPTCVGTRPQAGAPGGLLRPVSSDGATRVGCVARGRVPVPSRKHCPENKAPRVTTAKAGGVASTLADVPRRKKAVNSAQRQRDDSLLPAYTAALF